MTVDPKYLPYSVRDNMTSQEKCRNRLLQETADEEEGITQKDI
jgi:hypothetical protein